MRTFLLHLQLNNLSVRHVFLTNDALVGALKNRFHHPVWRAKILMENIRHIMGSLGEFNVHTIPRCLALAAFCLATHGSSLHELTLFHQGRDLPRWIMKNLLRIGVSFNL